MSLLSFTVKKARFVGSQASLWSSYATLKLQSVKSTTVVVKGASPSWEQDFLFELNNLDVGLLIEVWNKGRFWDNVIGYHYLYLSDIHCSNVAGAGQWLSLDAELVMRDGEVVGTKTPTGHVLLVDARFELPLGDVDGDEAVELQWKLEMLNSMLDQEARAEQCRRQQQYYIQSESGVSEDSDYTSDVNYPVGQHPNSSASQYLSAATRSLNSTRENSYEIEEDQRRSKGNGHSISPRGPQPGRLLPTITPSMHSYSEPNDSRNYETDPLYYNSRPQPYKPPYQPSYTESFDNGYGYPPPPPQDGEQFADDYQEPEGRRRPFRRKALSLERQETFYADEDLEAYGSSSKYWNDAEYGTSTVSKSDQHTPRHYRSAQQLNVYKSQPVEPIQPLISAQYNSSTYVDEKYNQPTPATDHVDNTRSTTNVIASSPYDGWYPATTSRDHYTPQQLPVSEYSQAYQQPPQQSQLPPNQSEKHTFQQQFGLNTLKKTIASVFHPISNHPSPTMLKPQVNTPATAASTPNLFAASMTSTKTSYTPSTSRPYAYTNTDQVVPQLTNPLDQEFEERFDFENWDFTNGYYDESGNFVPYQGYYDESGNFVPTDTPLVVGCDYYSTPVQATIPEEPTSNYNSTCGDAKSALDHRQFSEHYDYNDPTQDPYDPYYYSQSEVVPDTTEYPDDSSSFHAPNNRQSSVQSQSSVDYNYAYQSSDNLASSFDKPKSEASLDRSDSIMRRRSFRRQTSTRDYGLEGGPETPIPETQVSKPTPQAFKQATMDSRYSMSIDDYSGAAWTSQEYMDAEGGTMRTNSYEHFEDAEEHLPADEPANGEGPVHMDSLESNTSESGGGVRDKDANEKFEAQYWQRQRERIAEQATLCSQESPEYYGTGFEYDQERQPPQRLESIDEGPFSPPQSVTSAAGRRESEGEWCSGRSARSSVDQPGDWGSRTGSVTLKGKEVRRELSRQETMEGSIDIADQEYLGDYDDDESGHYMRKHSSVSIDSQGETLPPTSPPPEHSKDSNQHSLDDDSVVELQGRKESLDVPKDRGGPKTVSFEQELPKSVAVERLTIGMTSKEKWLWSMNRICSTLQEIGKVVTVSKIDRTWVKAGKGTK